MLMLALEIEDNKLESYVLEFVAENFVSACDAQTLESLDDKSKEKVSGARH